MLTWTNLSACDCLLAPLSGINLTALAIRFQHFILSNSYKLVRAPPAPCAGVDDTSSDDDEHNTDNNLLLLIADADIAPALLAGLSDVDELHMALGCRFVRHFHYR